MKYNLQLYVADFLPFVLLSLNIHKFASFVPSYELTAARNWRLLAQL
jgi:hypothetical protein